MLFKYLKYFHINNIRFNYELEFKNDSKKNYWKYNTPLIEYCETLGINIPHYCYHKNLSISGNCRMCLIELKNAPKPIVSCAMDAKSCLASGDIFTNSYLVKKARENILEFLLLNHPLDCPICDQGGECDLQDQSLFFGLTKKRFYNFRRVVINKNIGPIVKTVMSRCIHCTRCVRFASEIAGVDDIGMFGRGLQSEIGTYVEKVFQSELSGNVIDLCPVGALTSKPYPFLNRSWELKNVNFIDFSDGFCLPTQVCIKNNQVIKVLPGYDKTTNSTNWISDKTRFSFDSLFSPEKIVHNFINYNKERMFTNLSWKKLFKELFYAIYFQVHLAKHFFKPNQITICLTQNISLEVLSLLTILSNKYNFFKLRQSESYQVNNHFEYNYLLNSSVDAAKLATTNTCVLIGVNTRYEGFALNLKLRSRFLKGNFNVVTLGSLVDLTFSYTNLGNNFKILTSLAEGNNLFCQEFCNSLNPILICSSEMFKRKDSSNLTIASQFLTKHISRYSLSKTENKLNVLNSTVNKAGTASLNILKTINSKDVQNSVGIYFLNNSFKTTAIKKLLNLKLLGFFRKHTHENKVLITQSTILENETISGLKKNFRIQKHVNLPNTVFFETAETYMNTEGSIKKTVKVISPTGQTKSNWQIIRKIFAYSKRMLLVPNLVPNNKLVFNCNNVNYFKNYIGFHQYATCNLNNLSFNLVKDVVELDSVSQSYKYKRKKVLNTKLKYWLDDFYTGGKDGHSSYSSTMIQCSKFYQLNNTNFSNEIYKII